jgi:hypothetical protein
VSEFFDDLRYAEGFELHDFGRNQAEYGGETVFLFEVVATETRGLIHGVSEVKVACFEVFFECFGVANFGEEIAKIFSREDWLVGDGGNATVHTNFRWLAFGEVEVGAFGFDEILKVGVNACHDENE